MVAIVDYGSGNLRSVSNAVARLGYTVTVTSSPPDLLEARAVILPGVGAGGDTMRQLEKRGMSPVIRQLIADGRPLLAICVGMQVLLDRTEEGDGHDCFGFIPGTVRRLPAGLKVPHMGWNQVHQRVPHALYQGIPDGAYFYFIHSYYADPVDASVIAGETEYGVNMCSVVIRGNLVATQFHPEKSGSHGLRMLGNFLWMALGNSTF